jgi:hypothetical protein
MTNRKFARAASNCEEAPDLYWKASIVTLRLDADLQAWRLYQA